MLLKQNMIILITVMGLITLSCVDVPSTAPELTDTVKAAKTSAKTDEVIDVKTFEENTDAKSDERKDLIFDQEDK
ncbi:MAG: hypothetical protein IIA58_00250 [Candidatus Marinimicrobia bacterium]|nr:hypothetical protein [Candidatus Neomarinimicrobiota bacterium]